MGTVSRAAGTSVQQENKYGANKFTYDFLSGDFLSGDLRVRPGLRGLIAGDEVRALLVLCAPRFDSGSRLASAFAAGTGSA